MFKDYTVQMALECMTFSNITSGYRSANSFHCAGGHRFWNCHAQALLLISNDVYTTGTKFNHLPENKRMRDNLEAQFNFAALDDVRSYAALL